MYVNVPLSFPMSWMCAAGKAWCDLMLNEWVPHPDQIRVMETNEKACP